MYFVINLQTGLVSACKDQAEAAIKIGMETSTTGRDDIVVIEGQLVPLRATFDIDDQYDDSNVVPLFDGSPT